MNACEKTEGGGGAESKRNSFLSDYLDCGSPAAAVTVL